MQALHPLDFVPNKLLDFGPYLNYRFISTAYTVEKMTLWEYQNMDTYETICFRGNQMPSARVEGKLYQLTEEQMNELDTSKGVGLIYDRKLLPVMLPSGDLTTAHMLVANAKEWKEQLDFDIQFKRLRLAPRVPDTNRLIHGRFTIEPPIVVDNISQRVTAAIEQYCKQKNEAAVKSARMENWKRRIKNFLE